MLRARRTATICVMRTIDSVNTSAASELAPTTSPARSGWVAFLAHFLFVLAGWTITIKYLFPIGFALAEGAPLTRYIWWDLWPVAHVWLGWALLRWPWYTRYLAIGMALAEIAIIVIAFARFLPDPTWTIWRSNWFINKLFILLCFTMILVTFTLGWPRLKRDHFTSRQRAATGSPPTSDDDDAPSIA
jgi:hypothetical protein